MAEQLMGMEEFLDSLTGFDEIAIEKAFGADITSLLTKQATMSMRALVFVARRRDGLSDAEARKSVMEAPLSEVKAFFPDEEPEVTPDDPATEAGKDDELPG